MSPPVERGRKAIVAALLANLGIALAKLVGFAVTGSASMMAEALHSAADTGNQGLLFLGGARSRRQPTTEHPFGYGRERYFWAFVVAMVLFSFGSLFSLAEGVEKLRHPHEVGSAPWAIAILLVAVAFESLSLRTAAREADELRGQSGWWGFVRRSKNPELAVVLLEDTGALLGLVFALLGVTLAGFTGISGFDAVGSLAIGVLLGVIAIVLAVEMKSLLIGEAASESESGAIAEAIECTEHVRRLIHLRTLQLGPEELLVGAKVELDNHLAFEAVAEVVNAVEERVRQSVPAARIIYVEPDCSEAARNQPDRGGVEGR